MQHSETEIEGRVVLVGTEVGVAEGPEQQLLETIEFITEERLTIYQ